MQTLATTQHLYEEVIAAPDNPAAFTGPLQALIGVTIGAVKANRPLLKTVRYMVDENKRTQPLSDHLVSIFVEGVGLTALEGYNLLGNLQGYGSSLSFTPIPFDELTKQPRRVVNVAERLLVMYAQAKRNSEEH